MRALLDAGSGPPSASAMNGTGRYPPIRDYAVIGDCRSAALIGRDGSLDWLCWPRFDSPSLFAALLDRDRGGRFRVAARDAAVAERRYLENTNVLETVWEGASGRLCVRDLMPVASPAEGRRELQPDHEVLREVECLGGEIDVEVEWDPQPDYGRASPPAIRNGGPLGYWCEVARGLLLLRTDIPLGHGPDARPGLRGAETLRAGDRRHLSFSMARGDPAVLPLLGDAARERVERSVRWWREWVGLCRHEGPHRAMVVRSALALKLMTYAPSGAVIAAPTTSLPEWIGGVRNWDYRYCWLRDASLTLRALFDLGYLVEGEAFLSWLLHATRITAPELQVMYDVYGDTRLDERELAHLEGYGGSRPVRIGNAAEQQLQLDLYGKVVDAAYQFVRRGGELDPRTGRLLEGLGRTVRRRWRERDEGIWEIRGERLHHTQSKAMCWVALDRLLRLERAGVVSVPAEAYARERDAIRHEIETRGWNDELGSYVRVLDGNRLDAALLLLALYGYAEPAAPRMRATCERIREHLGEDGLIYRYKDVGDYDGLPGPEGAFGICSFWAVECLSRVGETEQAERDFERIVACANDVGLFAEQMDPATGEALGNFPQAFTHVGLIDAALTLAECEGERRPAQEPRVERLEAPKRV